MELILLGVIAVLLAVAVYLLGRLVRLVDLVQTDLLKFSSYFVSLMIKRDS